MIREDVECKTCGESITFNGPADSRNWNTIKTLFRVMHSYDHKPAFSQTEIETAPAAVMPETQYSLTQTKERK